MDEYYFPYEIDKPDNEFKLPSGLEEISGISYCGKDKIACVQDERAIIYLIDLGKKLKVTEYEFGKEGDYEDITIFDNTAYVLRNDGQIYKIKDFKKKDHKVTRYKTPLSGNNDTEGMTYSLLENSLLIACKSSPSISEEKLYEGFRAVYQFDLETKELIKDPKYLIDLGNLESYKDRNIFSSFSVKLAKKLRLVDSYTSFKPSGLAVHPIFDQIYLISSVGKLLIVIDSRGKILDIHDLDVLIFRQPEGICFSPSGDLYISNEGQGGKGTILEFNIRTNESNP